MVAAGLIVACVLPALPFAVPAATLLNSGNMPGGCHGHHAPVPVSSHSCCYARPQAPALVLLASSGTPLNAAAEVAPGGTIGALIVATEPGDAAFASPPQLILRI